MSSKRHLQRIAVMQTIFTYEFREQREDVKKTLERHLKEFEGKIDDPSFAFDLLDEISQHLPQIRKAITEKAPEWPIEKISPIDRAILEIGVYEILFSKDVPPVVAIDEAIEIAKSYGSENSPKFINGVLSSVMQSYESLRKT